ncbi:lysophospholipid acyltransferase family protein [Paraliomyxa miuraensis]|uniref:lysophospholipid acyltransferase family protein n=1 Tax=Paraliomyxa miuraensis TaxID=376150 RepID=UPI00224EB801|nr:lysophospholipid acyltransferase family protein [Paraliomyxa miuraensis]MCX4245324.1 1-acyl-sn-glycerol-3-phosphate acyltransferase [Paraliomyxa miuraensis]
MPVPSSRTVLGDLVWAPWSVVGWTGTLAWMGTIAAVALPMTLAGVPFENLQVRLGWQPAVAWPLWLMLSPLRVTYDPRYDKARVSVFTQNHVSVLDANIACGTIPVPLCGLENAAHLQLPGYGWLLRMSNAIPVRKGEGRFSEIADAFRERASRGVSVLAFPEAHRTIDGKLRPFKSGVFRAARDAGLPIVPIVSRGMYRMLPKGSVTVRPSRIEVYVAPQIETEGLSDDQLPALMDRVRTVMEAWIERKEMLGDLCLEPL